MTKKLKNMILTLSFAVLIACVGCGNEQKDPEVTATPMPTEATPTPTFTPTSTPTNTPTPTLTPTPSNTSTPTPTPIPERTVRNWYGEDHVPTFPCSAYVDCYSISLRNIEDITVSEKVIYNNTMVTLTGNAKNIKYYTCEYEGKEYYINKSFVTLNDMFQYDRNCFTIVDEQDLDYSYADMESDIKELAKTYPDLFSYYSAGKTADNRELYICTMGNPNAPKCIYITATAHAREYCTTHLVMMQAEYYLKYYYQGYYKNVDYRDLFDEICIVLMPMQNPDGVDLCIFGPSCINDLLLRTKIHMMCDRETEEFLKTDGDYNSNFYRRWKANAVGVDLNRNYPFGWEETNDYDVPASSGYKGPEPFSEIETQVQKQVLEKLMEEKDVVFAISYHASGNDLSWDVGQTGEFREECEKAADALVYVTDYIREMSLMNIGPIPLAGYTDWLNGEEIVPSITIEIFRPKVWLAVDTPEMNEAWVANREVWALLAELYYEGKGTQTE